MKKEQSINAIYIDLTTHKPAYSINYDRIFLIKKSIAYSYRVGFSVTKQSIYFPIGISLLTGKKSGHPEISLIAAAYTEGHNTFPTNIENSDTYLLVIPGIGYRYQRRKSGPFFRMVGSLVLKLDPPSDNFWKMTSQFYSSLFFSIGYSF